MAGWRQPIELALNDRERAAPAGCRCATRYGLQHGLRGTADLPAPPMALAGRPCRDAPGELDARGGDRHQAEPGGGGAKHEALALRGGLNG
jgi:hypothetical protein